MYPYEPGGYGTSIATALNGKVPLLRSPNGQLDWAFLRPQPPAKFVEGSGKVMSTIPPSDYSYFEMMNEVVQREPADSLAPETDGHQRLGQCGRVGPQPDSAAACEDCDMHRDLPLVTGTAERAGNLPEASPLATGAGSRC